MNAIEELLTAEGLAFLVGVGRAAGVVIVAPMPWIYAPTRVRVALVLMLGASAIGSPRTGPAASLDAPLTLALQVGSELLIGIAIGMVVRFAIAVAEMMGEIVAPLFGLGVAQIFDPGSSSSQNVLSILFRYLAIWVALSVGVHRELIGALIASFKIIPAGSAVFAAGALQPLLEISGTALVTATRLALPVLAVLTITQLALALISRAAPAMQVFNVGFAVTLVVGWVVLMLVLPDINNGLAADFSHVGTRIEQVLASLWVPS